MALVADAIMDCTARGDIVLDAFLGSDTTVIVELTVPDGWPIHITWAAMALGIMAYGPGRISLDHLIGRALSPEP